jgi:hypothetical protein
MMDFANPALRSRFWNRIKPLHRETLDSYSHRLLPANQENVEHQRHLVRLGRQAGWNLDADDTWGRVVTLRTGLNVLHFWRAQSTDLHHSDGTECDTCFEGVDGRWMCTRCGQGAEAQQYPHLDTIVCSVHSRWVGPGTPPSEQERVGGAWLIAEKQFQRLRRTKQLDAHLYTIVRNAFREARRACPTKKETMTQTDIAIFPMMMLALNAILASAFLAELFDPRKRYATAFQVLDNRVRATVGDGYDVVTRALWLHMRPTFLAVREHVLGAAEYRRHWEHDFDVPAKVLAALPSLAGPNEAFRNFLTPTHDYELTEDNWKLVVVHHYPPASPRERSLTPKSFDFICRNGHRLSLSWSGYHSFKGDLTDSCGVCAGKVLLSGTNDIATLYPRTAEHYRPETTMAYRRRNSSPRAARDASGDARKRATLTAHPRGPSSKNSRHAQYAQTNGSNPA